MNLLLTANNLQGLGTDKHRDSGRSPETEHRGAVLGS